MQARGYLIDGTVEEEDEERKTRRLHSAMNGSDYRAACISILDH